MLYQSLEGSYFFFLAVHSGASELSWIFIMAGGREDNSPLSSKPKLKIGTIKANTGPPTANAAIEAKGLFLGRQKDRRQKKQAPSLEPSRLVCRMAAPDQTHRGCPRLFKNYFHLLKKRERSLERP